MFGMDPVVVLAEADPFRFALRVGAYRAVQNERAKAAAKAK